MFLHPDFIKLLIAGGTQKVIAVTLARTLLYSESRARRGSNTRPLDLQSNALPTAPQAPGDDNFS